MELYAPLVGVYYASGGIGYIVSILVAPEVSQLIGVITVFSFAMFSGECIDCFTCVNNRSRERRKRPCPMAPRPQRHGLFVLSRIM